MSAKERLCVQFVGCNSEQPCDAVTQKWYFQKSKIRYELKIFCWKIVGAMTKFLSTIVLMTPWICYRCLSVSKARRNALLYGMSVQKFWAGRNKGVGDARFFNAPSLWSAKPVYSASCASIGWEQFMKFSDTPVSAIVTFCVMSLTDSKQYCFDLFLRLEYE
jgi:hypothetical protein